MIKEPYNTLEHLHSYSVLIDSREIFLNPKDADNQTDILLATSFIKNLRLLESINKNDIIIHQYNAGGELPAAFAIFDAIKDSACHISMIAHGEVMSCGLLILQAADIRLAMKNCEFLAHEGTTGIHDSLSHKQAKSWSIREKFKAELLYDIYTDKCMAGQFFLERKYKKNRIKAYLKAQISKNEDWFLSADEAMEFGFIDDIIGNKKYPHISNLLNL